MLKVGNNMNKKILLIPKLITSLIITLFLLYILINSSDNITKIVIIPFLICSFTTVGRNIFIMLEKTKYIKLFTKIFILSFLVFWFGVLFYGCYRCYLDKNYSVILFSIPFWLIGILLIKKYLLEKKG